MFVAKSCVFVCALILLTAIVLCAPDESDQLYSFTINERRSAKHLTRPLWLDPRKTWANFLRNNERTDREHNKRRKKFQKRCERMWKNKVCSCKM